MEQLSSLVTMSAQLADRLARMGHREAAESILGVPLPEPGPPTTEPPEPVPPPPPEEPPPPPPEEPPPPPEAPPPEAPKEPRERYLLKGSSIFIPMLDPETAFNVMLDIWNKAMIGSPRDPTTGRPIDPRPRYAPDAVARGTTVDAGMQIPMSALRSVEAFVAWAGENGFEQGLSIEIDGLVAPPGRAVMSAAEADRLRQQGRGRPRPDRTWTAPMPEGVGDGQAQGAPPLEEEPGPPPPAPEPGEEGE